MIAGPAVHAASSRSARVPGLLLIAAAVLFGTNLRAAEHPNVVFLISDDQRPDSIGSLGHPVLRTPHLDRLVREGTTFPRAIVAIPICVASRAEILTGRDGLSNRRADFGFSPAKDVTAWATALGNAGYSTCYVGKWHTVGRPSDYGYQTTEGLYGSGGGKYPLSYPQDWKGMDVTGYRGWLFQTDDGRLFPERGVGLTPDISEDFADAALRFIERDHQRPFFLHVNFTAPHDPLFYPTGMTNRYPPDSIPLPPNFLPRHPFDHGNFEGRDEKLFAWPRTPDETRRGLSVYYAVIEHLDRQVGRILAALQDSGHLEKTIVVYSSDHGLAMGSHGLRGKQNMYEHSIGVPLIFRGPNIAAGVRRDAQCYLRDVYPTTCELCGVPIPPTVQGRSLAGVISGDQQQVYSEVYAHFRDSQRMVRTNRWKFVTYPLVQQEQLFDLQEDPAELNNLVDDPAHSETAETLRQRLLAWRRQHADPTLSR